jgi:hypothetical protein
VSAVLSDTRTGGIRRLVLEPAFHLGMHLSLCWRDSLIVPAARLEAPFVKKAVGYATTILTQGGSAERFTLVSTGSG